MVVAGAADRTTGVVGKSSGMAAVAVAAEDTRREGEGSVWVYSYTAGRWNRAWRVSGLAVVEGVGGRAGSLLNDRGVVALECGHDRARFLLVW